MRSLRHVAKRGGTRLTILLLLLGLAAAAAAAAAFRSGLLGDVVLQAAPREPLERTTRAAATVGLLDVRGRDCPEATPADPVQEAWQAWVKSLSWSPRVVALSDDAENLTGVSLIVAPGPVCLSRAEAAALRTYVRGGGGLLAAGALRLQDGRGGQAAWSLLEELLGAEHIEALPDDGPALVAFRDGSPLAMGLEALTLDPARKGRALAVAAGPHPYWSDSRLNPIDRALPQGYQAAALTATFGKGRVAWLGFAVEPASARPDDPGRRLLQNAATWAARMPVVSLAPWPPPHRSAVLLQANVAGLPRNASFVARSMLDAHVGGAFVVPPELVDELVGLDPPLSRIGQVAVAATGGHSSPDSPLEAKARHLRIRRVLGAWPTGLFARKGEEQAALASAAEGFDFYLTEGASGRGRPIVRRATRRWGPWLRSYDVVGFSRLAADDLGLSPLGFAGLQPGWLRRRLLSDFEIAAALGGLHVLSFHTQGLGAPHHVNTLSELVADFTARGAWVAGPAELASWSRARAGLELNAETTTPDRLSLTLRATADPPGAPVGVDVYPPPSTRAVVAPGFPDCRAGEPLPGGAVQLVMRVGRPGVRDYRCDVTFVP